MLEKQKGGYQKCPSIQNPKGRRKKTKHVTTWVAKERQSSLKPWLVQEQLQDWGGKKIKLSLKRQAVRGERQSKS